MTNADRTLDGIRVLDFTLMIAGPYAGRLLADAGAEVLKIESPTGDPMRTRTPIRDGESTYFGSLNARKKSVVLDLKSPEDAERARQLVASADIVVENFRPGVMAKFGLDYETCRSLNPDIIYCSISGYGQSGPLADHPAYAPILHAMAGYDLTNMQYQLDAETPNATGTFVADVMAGQVAYGAILTSLIRKLRGGGGDHIDVALLDVVLSILVYEVQAAQATNEGPAKTVYRPIKVGDEFIIIAAITDKNFRAIAALMDRRELLDDVRFNSMGAREANWEEWQQIIASWAVDQDVRQLQDQLLAVGVPCGRFRSVAEAISDEHAVHRGIMTHAADPAGGTYRFIGPAFLSSATESARGDTAAVPKLGEHTRQVLSALPRQ